MHNSSLWCVSSSERQSWCHGDSERESPLLRNNCPDTGPRVSVGASSGNVGGGFLSLAFLSLADWPSHPPRSRGDEPGMSQRLWLLKAAGEMGFQLQQGFRSYLPALGRQHLHPASHGFTEPRSTSPSTVRPRATDTTALSRGSAGVAIATECTCWAGRSHPLLEFPGVLSPAQL